MVSKEKINLLIVSAIIVFAMIIAYPFYAPSKHNLYVLNLNENIVNNNFDYLKSSSSNSAKSHKRIYKEEIQEDLVPLSDYSKVKRANVDFTLKDDRFNKNSFAKSSNKENINSAQGEASGVYFSKGRSKGARTLDIHSSQGFIASNLQDDKPFSSNPQFAPNDVTDGGDPGGDPSGDPLPLKDDLMVLSILALAYFMITKKSRLK